MVTGNDDEMDERKCKGVCWYDVYRNIKDSFKAKITITLLLIIKITNIGLMMEFYLLDGIVNYLQIRWDKILSNLKERQQEISENLNMDEETRSTMIYTS